MDSIVRVAYLYWHDLKFANLNNLDQLKSKREGKMWPLIHRKTFGSFRQKAMPHKSLRLSEYILKSTISPWFAVPWNRAYQTSCLTIRLVSLS